MLNCAIEESVKKVVISWNEVNGPVTSKAWFSWLGGFLITSQSPWHQRFGSWLPNLEGVTWWCDNSKHQYCSFDIVSWISCNPMLLSLRWVSEVHYIARSLYIITKSLQILERFSSLFLHQISVFAQNSEKPISCNIYSLHCCKILKRHR